MSRRVIERWKWACAIASPRLTGTQRAVLHVVAAHADADAGRTTVGQETMAESAGVTDRAVRNALGDLEAMGLIAGERRPGKTTVWTVDADWTPEADFQGCRSPIGESVARGPRKPTSSPAARDPGSPLPAPSPNAPEIPRKHPGSRLPTKVKELQRQHLSLSSNGSTGRGEGEREVEFDPYTLSGPPRLR